MAATIRSRSPTKTEAGKTFMQPQTAQKVTTSRVMQAFQHGELRIRASRPEVKKPRQALAPAFHKAGAANQHD
jgi:hypothetical protein